jgi:hypothetical protein
MKKIIAAIAGLTLSGAVQATLLILDFNSGVTVGAPVTSYSEDGFTLAVDSVGNRMEDNYGSGAMGFYDGPPNALYNNDLTLSYGGTSFDLLDIDLSYFFNNGEVELIGSDGSKFASSIIGKQDVNFHDVTSVTFSMKFNDNFGYRGVAWNDITVDITSPGNSIPEPTSVVLFGLALVGFGLSRTKKTS